MQTYFKKTFTERKATTNANLESNLEYIIATGRQSLNLNLDKPEPSKFSKDGQSEIFREIKSSIAAASL